MNSRQFQRNFLIFFQKKSLWSTGDRILLTVSGGIDSVVMTHLFSKSEIPFGIAHCNFRLRGEESDQDAQFTRELAEKYQAEFFYKEFDTREFATRNKLSVQAAARELRYKWFEKIRKDNNYQHIATAHHLDDEAETFLLNLIRGTGIAGLHGIPVKNGFVIRPLMFAYRHEIEGYATENGIAFRSDSSNHELKYTRNNVRHRLIPLINELNPAFGETIHETISRLSESERINRWIFDQWSRESIRLKDSVITIDLLKVNQLPEIRSFLWYVLSPYGFSETQVHNLITGLNSSESLVFLAGDHRLIKERNEIRIDSLVPDCDTREFQIPYFDNDFEMDFPQHLKFKKYSRSMEHKISKDPGQVMLDVSGLTFPLVLRKWIAGDRFQPYGMKGKKKVSDFLTDEKMSKADKEQTWVLCTGDQIIWVVGQRPDHRFRVSATTRTILEIKFAKFAK